VGVAADDQVPGEDVPLLGHNLVADAVFSHTSFESEFLDGFSTFLYTASGRTSSSRCCGAAALMMGALAKRQFGGAPGQAGMARSLVLRAAGGGLLDALAPMLDATARLDGRRRHRMIGKSWRTVRSHEGAPRACREPTRRFTDPRDQPATGVLPGRCPGAYHRLRFPGGGARQLRGAPPLPLRRMNRGRMRPSPAGTARGSRTTRSGISWVGRMGEVYRGTDLRLRRRVALKFLRPFADPTMRQRLMREAAVGFAARPPEHLHDSRGR